MCPCITYTYGVCKCASLYYLHEIGCTRPQCTARVYTLLPSGPTERSQSRIKRGKKKPGRGTSVEARESNQTRTLVGTERATGSCHPRVARSSNQLISSHGNSMVMVGGASPGRVTICNFVPAGPSTGIPSPTSGRSRTARRKYPCSSGSAPPPPPSNKS